MQFVYLQLQHTSGNEMQQLLDYYYWFQHATTAHVENIYNNECALLLTLLRAAIIIAFIPRGQGLMRDIGV